MFISSSLCFKMRSLECVMGGFYVQMVILSMIFLKKDYRCVICLFCHSPGMKQLTSENLSMNLRKTREGTGKTQTELATVIGIAPEQLNHFEAGRRRPNLGSFIKLANALKTSADSLLK